MKRNCSICLKRVEGDDAPVLAMGGYGNPKVLCDECAELIDKMTLSRDYDEITAAINGVAERMSAANIDDRVTVATMTEMFESSAKRAQSIKEGTYDFALDEVESDEGFDEIPEELLETEEDKARDEKEAKFNKKLDKITNWIWVVVFAGVAVFFVLRLLRII